MIVVPYRTDAAIDHGPWGTVSLMLANVAVAIFLGFPEWAAQPSWIEVVEPTINSWVLEFGTVDARTWLTHAFVHVDVIHLLGNLMFLLSFGLVVEGFLGWQRFLPLYLGIACAEGAIVQVMMFGADEGGAAGASGAIFGLMAIAALWAPRNRLAVFLGFYPFFRTIEVSIVGFCVFFIGLNVLVVMASDFQMGTALLHTLGATIGFGIGLCMLKMKWVDCEGWDLISLRTKRSPGLVRMARAATPREPRIAADPGARAFVRLRAAIEQEDGPVASDAYRTLKRARPDWDLTRGEHMRLLRLLLDSRSSDVAITCMEDFLQRHPDGSVAVRLILADRLLRVRRPARALSHIEALDAQRLTARQRNARRTLAARAREVLAYQTLELE